MLGGCARGICWRGLLGLPGVLGEEFHGCVQMTLKALQGVFGLTDVEVFKAAPSSPAG